MNQNQSRLDQEPLFSRVKQLISEGRSNGVVAQEVNCSESAVRRFRKRHGFADSVSSAEQPGVKFNSDGSGEITTEPKLMRLSTDNQSRSPQMADPATIMREHGLDPEEWIMERIKLNRWDGPIGEGVIATYHQVTLHVKPRYPVALAPVRSDGWKAPKRLNRTDGAHTVLILGDPQAPYADPHLLECTTEWIRKHQPARGVVLGDVIDLPGEVSRHPNTPETDALVMDCVQSGYDWLRAVVESDPNCEWDLMPGNHDERIRKYIVERAPALFDLRRATRPGEDAEKPVWDLPYLMRMDELGINYIDPQGAYDQAQVKLSRYLAVRHGWIAKKGGGASALASLEHLGHSILVGHTHRQSIVHKTSADIDGNVSVLKGVEIGCMCLIDPEGIKNGLRFPTYTVNPDWQQGFAVANIHDDGRFSIELATYVNNQLYYRDEVYS